MRAKRDEIRLSKQVAYALRHAPAKFGLELDEEGWVSVKLLLSALSERGWTGLQEQDLLEMMHHSDKKRFELRGGRIRALYGHSLPEKIQKQAKRPPEILYHGTARRFLPSIRKQGLLPEGRQYVHLSLDRAAAVEVGRRHDREPVILKVKTGEAWRSGLAFYPGNEQVWLADRIPPHFIEFKHTGPEQDK